MNIALRERENITNWMACVMKVNESDLPSQDQDDMIVALNPISDLERLLFKK
jgi:hypothetical protein